MKLPPIHEDVQIILVLLLIAALIISIIFAAAAVYDYLKVERLTSVELHKEFIDNCIPSTDMPEDPTLFINNGTHTYQLQTCRWIGTNGVNMSDILWDNFINIFNEDRYGPNLILND